MRQSTSLLVFNGTVHTCNPNQPRAGWVHVDAGRVRAVGEGAPPHPPEVPRLDLRGRTLAPAFHDAHVHLTWIATSFLGVDLSACDGVPAVLDALAAWRGPGRGTDAAWIVGTGFDESGWRDRRLPARAEIDRVESRRPVLLQRVCGHVGVVNTAALARLTPGAFTDRDSGRLDEEDLYAVNDLLRPSAGDLETVLPEVTAVLYSHGITAVHDVTPPEMLHALQRAAHAQRLGVRVTSAIPARYLGLATAASGADHATTDPAEWFAARGLGGVPVDARDPWLRVLGVKLFLDGSLGARTAALRAPYADATETRGLALYELEDLRRIVGAVDDAGLQLMVHAIGDAALDLALDALEPVLRDGNARRHRLEHVEVTPPDLVTRLARSRVRACVQPNFAGRWSQPGGMNGQRLGARLAHCNAYRTLHAAGVPLAFGSDCMPLGPLFGLRAAIAHPLAAERLPPAVALHLYTAAAAELTHAETRQGRIEPGMQADFVVLSQDLDRADWDRLQVDATFLAGRPVFERPP